MTSVLLDSWALIEIFKGGPLSDKIKALSLNKQVYTTVLNLYELFYRICEDLNEQQALDAVQIVTQSVYVLSIENSLALQAAKKRPELRKFNKNLSAIDVITYSAAQIMDALLITGDPDFKNVPGVILL